MALQRDLWPWYVCGPAGTGKSYAAACVHERFPGEMAAFWPAAKAIRDLAAGYMNILATVQDVDLLVLDDFGTRDLTDPQAEAFLSILNTRGRKPMIVTGNHGVKGLRDSCRDDRIASRLLSGTIVEIKGADRRLEGARIIGV